MAPSNLPTRHGRRRFLAFSAACIALRHETGVAQAVAKDFPTKPIMIVVGFPAGGPADFVARTIASRLAAALGVQVIVDNRPGAGGNVAAMAVARAPADGHTLLMASTSLSVNPSLYKKLPYDPERDFAPVAMVASTPLVLVTHASSGVASLTDLIKQAKASPGKMSYGSGGSGTLTHLGVELLKQRAGLFIVHVPYRGVAPMLTDLIGGQVEFALDTMVTSVPQVRAGRLKALAVASARRSALLPDVPAIAELGFAGYEVVGWYGLMAPAHTPTGVTRRIADEVAKVLADKQVIATFAGVGAEPYWLGSDAMAAFLKSEIGKWGVTVKYSGATVD